MAENVILKSYKPSIDLSQLISRFMYNKSDIVKADLKLNPVSSGRTEIYFHLNNSIILNNLLIDSSDLSRQSKLQASFIVGIEGYTNKTIIDLKNIYEAFIVEFYPGAFYHIFGVAESELYKHLYNLSLFGKSEIAFLTEMINMASSNEARVNIFEAFVRSKIKLKKPIPQVGNLFSFGPNYEENSIKNICLNNGMDIRKLERKYKEIIGICPIQYLHIQRINNVFRNLHLYKKHGWAMLSTMLGYYDQSHFIKDFKNITGITPAEFVGKVPEFFYTQQFSNRTFLPIVYQCRLVSECL
jgi:AraC-like DNA-binding protein